MFGIFSIIRFSPSATVLITVGMVVLTGCQCFSPKPIAVTPQLPPVSPVIPPPNPVEPAHYSVFRPIMQGEQLQPDAATLSKIDELNRRITELETQLAEATKIQPPVPVEEFFVSTPVPPQAQNLPIINQPGVSIYRDESQCVRFVVLDKALFTPNVWELSAEGEETLRAIAAEIRAFDPEAVLDIEGHTDSLMSDPNNPTQKHEIASVKTKVVMDFFVNALRWDTAELKTSSFGKNRPIEENGTPEGREKNNRIEIVLRSTKK